MNLITKLVIVGLVASFIKPGHLFKSPWEYLTSESLRNDRAAVKGDQICTNSACNDYAKMIKNNIDPSVNPCDDFYRFTCGNYMKTTPIPADQSQLSQFRSLDQNVRSQLVKLLSQPFKSSEGLWIENAKKFYSSCVDLTKVNHHTVLSAKELINDIGGWPMMTGLPNPNSPVDIMIKLNDYQFSPFAVITVSPNPKDPMNYIIKVYQPDYNPTQLYDSSDYEKAYTEYFKIALTYLNSVRKVNENDISKVFQLVKSLAKIQMTLSERKNGTRNVEMTVAELQKQIPQYPWTKLISSNGIFSNILNVKVNESELVSVDDWDYLVKMQAIFADYAKNQPEVLKNYLIASFFYSTINDLLPEQFLKAKINVSKFLTGVSALEDRKLFCVSKAQNYIPNEIGKLYVSKQFSKAAKSDALQMTRRILNEFKSMLKNLTWMDEESKQKALNKADFIKPQIGYPDRYDNSRYLATNYNYVLDNYDLVVNALDTLQYSQRGKILGMLRKPVDRDEWFATPAIVNAFYEPSNNQIYFPAGILNSPFYNANLPKYINYGAIGTVIGHEITHGFDDEGRHYDKYGRYYSDKEDGLWSQDTINSFKNRTQCMIDQYNGFVVKEINKTINGYQTLGENIADNGGLKEAYRTYKKWEAENPKNHQPLLPGVNYNQDQLFFIGIAQVWCSKIKPETLTNLILTNAHALPEFRVIGMSQNSDDFQRVFNCPNPPAKKCTVW